jgi:hypothetical protein
MVDHITAHVGTLVDRKEHGVDRPLPHGADRFGYGVAVQHREAADTGRIQAGSLGGSQYSSDRRTDGRDLA